jgi:rhamnosyltransferase
MPDSPSQFPNICAIVVTYHPDAALLDNLSRLHQQVPNIIIVDNGSDASSAGLLAEAERRFSARVTKNSQNLGIAAALNIGIKQASSSGYQWLATFDQDSSVTPGYFESLLSAYEHCPFREKVPLVAPELCYSQQESMQKRAANSSTVYSLTRTAMTSGSLIKPDIFSKVGFYDETFFMDYVDYEFCLRLWKAGWKVFRANQAHLLHRLGTPQTHSFLGFKVQIKSHNPWRRYYIMRNRVIVFRRYAFSSPLWCLYDFMWIFLELAKILFFEAKKREQLASTIRGIKDGLLWRAQTTMCFA